MVSLPPSPQGWVALSPPRTPVLRYHEAAPGDASPSSARYTHDALSSSSTNKGSVSPLTSGRYAAARVDLSNQLTEMEADMAGLETVAHRAFGSAVDRYHHLIVASSPGPAARPRTNPALETTPFASPVRAKTEENRPEITSGELDECMPKRNGSIVIPDATPSILDTGYRQHRQQPQCLTPHDNAFAAEYPALTRACILHATGKQQRGTPRTCTKSGRRIAPLSPPIVPPAPPELRPVDNVKGCDDSVDDQARARAAARIQRRFRARANHRRAVRVVAETWTPPSAEDFQVVASLVVGVARVRAQRQRGSMRRALAQLHSYSSARAERRRQLHIRRVRFGRYMHQYLDGGAFDGTKIFAESGRLAMVHQWARWRRCAIVWVALLRYSFGPRHIQYG